MKDVGQRVRLLNVAMRFKRGDILSDIVTGATEMKVSLTTESEKQNQGEDNVTHAASLRSLDP